MPLFESLLVQLVERRNHLVEDARAEIRRRDELLQIAQAAGREHLSQADQAEFDRRSRTVAQFAADIEALDGRVTETRAEIERSGRGNPVVDRLRHNTRGAGTGFPLGFSQEQLRAMHAAILENRTLKIESRAFSTVDPLLPPQLWPVVIGPEYEDRLLDRLPGAAATAPSVEFIQHQSTTGTPAPTAEGAVKSELVYNTDKVIIPMVKIAAHTATSWESLYDFLVWQSYVTAEISRQVINVENDQLLNGSGTGGNVAGFLHTTGILVYQVGGPGTTPDGETPLDGIESAIAALRTGPALATADLAIFHPSTWSAIRKSKDTMGRYLTTPDPTADTASSLWGVPVLQTTQIAAGDGLLLDTTKFGRVWLRESLNMRTGYMNDDLVRNQIRFVCEERLNLAVERPAAVMSVSGLPLA